MDSNSDSDDYERARERQIKENRALLESLGLNSESVRLRSPSPPRPVKRVRTVKTQPASVSPPPERQRSSRIASSSRQTYNEKELTRRSSTRQEKAVRAREGDRKSKRLSAGRSKYTEANTSDTDSENDYVPAKSTPVFQLKKIRNPSPPILDDSDDDTTVFTENAPLPTRLALKPGMGGRGPLNFEKAWSHFRPNLTPEEVVRGGAFGGTFFRTCYSGVLKRDLVAEDDIAELPQAWIEGLDQDVYLKAKEYSEGINKFGKKAGQSLQAWEQAGWIARQDPRGWFQWYCRFYSGRRSADDARQVQRWQRACGPAGRFKRAVAAKVAKAGAAWDDGEIAAVLRQVIWQWACELSQEDYEAYFA